MNSGERLVNEALRDINRGNYTMAEKLLREAITVHKNEHASKILQWLYKLRFTSYSEYQDGGDDCNDSAWVDTEYEGCGEKSSTYGNDNAGASNQWQGQYEGLYTPSASDEFTRTQLDLVTHVKNCSNFYEILDVHYEATADEIKKSYRKIALLLHPDKNRAPGAAEAFKVVANAVAVLTDVRKRKEYDLNILLPRSKSVENVPDRRCFRNTFTYSDEMAPEEVFNMFCHSTNNSTGTTTTPNSSSSERPRTCPSYYTPSAPTAEEHQQQRPRFVHPYNQRQPPHANGTAFTLLLVCVIISIMLSLLTTDAAYSLAKTNVYSVRRVTQRNSVPYYVRSNFGSNFHGSLASLEANVEHEYITAMKQNCFQERNYREKLLNRARILGNRRQMAQAQGIKLPSCENLARLGLTRLRFA